MEGVIGKMKNIFVKRLLAVFLVASLAIVGFSACSSQNADNADKGENNVVNNKGEDRKEGDKKEESGSQSAEDDNTSSAIVGNIPIEFPLVSEPTSINVLSCVGNVASEDIYVLQEYEKMTGIQVNWTDVTEDRKEKIAAALASGADYDLILKGGLSAAMLGEYGSQGLIVDLMEDDILEKYAPNAWAYFQGHPDTLASILDPDGSIYGLPQVNAGPELRVSRKVFINKNWLDNVDMELPTTTDELYELLVAFKEQDANGNGDSSDEIPLCTQDWYGFQDMFYGAFGLGNRGQHNLIVDWDYEKDTVRLIPTSDGYKEMLQFMNKLYVEGLVDEELFTMTKENWTTKAADDRIGVFAFTNLASLPGNLTENWIGIEEALEGPNGDKLWNPVRANFHSTGNAVIPETSDKVKEVLQWLDYFWTDEGTLFYHYGIEGETFVANDDGTYDFTDEIYDQMKDGASYDDVVAKYSLYPGGRNPTVEVAPYFGGGEMAPIPAKAANDLFEYRPEEIWPNFTFTAEENSYISQIQTDIQKYYESERTEFITGTKSFDEWDSYVKAMNDMKADKLLEVYSAAVERYNELVEEMENN